MSENRFMYVRNKHLFKGGAIKIYIYKVRIKKKAFGKYAFSELVLSTVFLVLRHHNHLSPSLSQMICT